MSCDFWNPSTWDLEPRVCRLYVDDRLNNFVLLEDHDFWWACQWRWHINAPHRRRNGKKQYAVRCPGNGRRYLPKLYLHVEIMRRTGIVPPTVAHTLVDHRDGNEFNCLRANLRWATPAFNARNINGALATDFFEQQSMVVDAGKKRSFETAAATEPQGASGGFGAG